VEILDAQVEALDGNTALTRNLVLPDADLTEKERETIIVEAFVLAMDAVGVDGGLWHSFRSIAETATELFPERFRGIALCMNPDEQDAETEVNAVLEHPGLVGIRVAPAWPPTGEMVQRLHEGAFAPWFREAEKHDLPVSLFISNQLKEVPGIIKEHPNVRLMIDHLGFIPSLSYEEYPFNDLWPACHQIIEAFGPDRMMWGADFHRVGPLCSYGDMVNFLRLTPEVSEADKEKMFSTTLRSWIGWEDAIGREAD
jgi:L-fuconolactonase